MPPESACSAARDGRNRCWGWSHTLPLHYHDNVWGRPVRDDSTALFGNMCLQVRAAGLDAEAEWRRKKQETAKHNTHAKRGWGLYSSRLSLKRPFTRL